jgi:hypothetical protein
VSNQEAEIMLLRREVHNTETKLNDQKELFNRQIEHLEYQARDETFKRQRAEEEL